MAGFNIFAADAEEDAAYVRSSSQQAILNLHVGQPGPLPKPIKEFEASLSPGQRGILDRWFECSASGTPERVREQLEGFIARTGVDEVMVTSSIHDHQARLRSFEITASLAT